VSLKDFKDAKRVFPGSGSLKEMMLIMKEAEPLDDELNHFEKCV
jgi:hypothetical protein